MFSRKWRSCEIMPVRFVILILFNSFITGVLFAQPVELPYINGSLAAIDSTRGLNVSVIIIHQPSGTKYATIAETPGYFNFKNLRTGGPYLLICSATGYETDSLAFDELKIGDHFSFEIVLKPRYGHLEELIVQSKTINKYQLENSAQRFIIGKDMVQNIPISGRTVNDLLKLHPFYGAGSFIGKNPRFNSFTIDGSLLVSFGLNNTIIPGNAADTDPLSMDAIDQFEISLAPVEITQYGFSGAALNVTSKKGENKPGAGIYYYLLNGSFNKKRLLQEGSKQQYVYGVFAGGPIRKDKLFYYLNYELKRNSYPATVFETLNAGNASSGFVTRVQQKDMDSLSAFLRRYYNYSAGGYEDYTHHSYSHKLSFQLDWNIKEKHKLDIKFITLAAEIERLLGNSEIFGIGNRNNNLYSLNYENSNYTRINNAFSTKLEYNYKISAVASNQFFFNYSFFNDSRRSTGNVVPLVDILQDGLNYISFGTDPFAPENKVTNKIIQVQNNFSLQRGKHLLTGGFNFERITARNAFLPGWNGAFVFNSLQEFYNSFPAGTSTPMGMSNGNDLPSGYKRMVSLLPGIKTPAVNPSYQNLSLYAEDKFHISKKFLFSFSLRADRISHPGKPYFNQQVETFEFQDVLGNIVKLNTSTLPEPGIRLSPRIGMSADLINNRLNITFSSGLYLGRLPMVLLSEQFRNNGLLFNTIELTKNQIPFFDYSLNAYNNLQTVQPSIDVVSFSPEFKYPQAWRSVFGLNERLGRHGTISLNILYSKDIHAIRFYNVNIDNTRSGTGANGREYLLEPAINAPYIHNAYYVSNYSSGYQFFINMYYKYLIKNNFLLAASYTYGNSKDISTITGTEPQSDFNNLAVAGNPNKAGLAHSAYDTRHRVYALLNWRIPFPGKKEQQLNIGFFAEAVQSGRYSYVYSGKGDVNGDGIYGNDLIFVPAAKDQINLVAYADNNTGNIVSEDEQWQALDKFIANDPYLKHRRGQFAERNGAILPFNFSNDVRFSYSVDIGKKLNTLISLDIFNVLNLLNASWNLGKTIFVYQPVEALSRDSFAVYPTRIMKTFTQNSSSVNGWQLQLGFRLTWK